MSRSLPPLALVVLLAIAPNPATGQRAASVTGQRW